jgi:hypothetical protein
MASNQYYWISCCCIGYIEPHPTDFFCHRFAEDSSLVGRHTVLSGTTCPMTWHHIPEDLNCHFFEYGAINDL